MKQYLDLVRHIRDNGVVKSDRTGVGTKSVFGYQMRFDLDKGFPLVTTKFTSFRLIATELLWFLGGKCNKLDLQAMDNHIWDEWNAPYPEEPGDMGPIYGVQWRSWPGKTEFGSDSARYAIDQINDVIERIKTNPNDRRMIVSAWNVSDLHLMALPPCHVMFQFYVANGKLSCQLYQRSSDVFLGVPFNIASYALLTKMIAHVTGLEAGEFIWTSGDTHLYLNHEAQVEELLSRTPVDLPWIELKRQVTDIDDFKLEYFNLVGYIHQGSIKAPVAV